MRISLKSSKNKKYFSGSTASEFPSINLIATSRISARPLLLRFQFFNLVKLSSILMIVNYNYLMRD